MLRYLYFHGNGGPGHSLCNRCRRRRVVTLPLALEIQRGAGLRRLGQLGLAVGWRNERTGRQEERQAPARPPTSTVLALMLMTSTSSTSSLASMRSRRVSRDRE